MERKTAHRLLIEAEHDLDYALQWDDHVGIGKAQERIKQLEAAVRQERIDYVHNRLRGLFNTFNPLSK